MAITKAILPVAGMGTRLLPATKSQPKEMLPVGRKPVVQYVVEEMIDEGIDKFLFITGRKKRSIEDHFDDDPELEARLSTSATEMGQVDYDSRGVEFFYARQRRPAGTADAVRMASEFVKSESFVVAFGDTILSSPDRPGVVGRMIEAHERREAAATIGVWQIPREETFKYGIVKPTEVPSADRGSAVFDIEDIVEKPAVEEAPSCLAVAARYVFTPRIFETIEQVQAGVGGELWLTDAIRLLIAAGDRVQCVPLGPGERRYDIGSPLTYYRAFVDFALADPDYGDAFASYLRELQTESLRSEP